MLAIRHQDLERWLQEKAATEGGCWKHFKHNPQIYLMAHEHSSKISILDSKKRFVTKKKIVDIKEFRSFLVQLFAISILWAHFKKADEFLLANDAYNYQLNEMEFKVGINSFCAAYGQEVISDEQLKIDFNTLDIDKSGSISFSEVCIFCCKFIDPKYYEQLVLMNKKDKSTDSDLTVQPEYLLNEHYYNNSQATSFNSSDVVNFSKEVLDDLKTKSAGDELSMSTKPSLKRKSVIPLTKDQADEALTGAMESVMAEVEKNLNIAQLVEFKIATEISLKEQLMGETSQPQTERTA
eukprot:gene6724-7244_t